MPQTAIESEESELRVELRTSGPGHEQFPYAIRYAARTNRWFAVSKIEAIAIRDGLNELLPLEMATMSKINTETVLSMDTVNLVTWVSQREPGKEWQDGQKALEGKISDYVDNLSLREAKITLRALDAEDARLKRLRETVKETKKTVRDALLSTKDELPGFD